MGPRGGLYVSMLWGGGRGLGAHPEGVPQVGEPQEKELCVGPPAALGYVDGSGGGGTVFPGGLRLSPVSRVPLNNNNNNNDSCKILMMENKVTLGLRQDYDYD
jgi:hypothetical protein